MNSVHKNHLARETSPYLLQHVSNPVEWYPWGENAINRARAENKPILLSIGYAACHWCHVMAHESFEDLETAKIMNNLFVCIKVDREERPDLDQIYMNFVQMSTGSGGWPLNVFLTPDLEPFFGGTYFPPEDRYGRASWKKILVSVNEFYHSRKAELHQNLELIREAYQRNMHRESAKNIPDAKVLTSALQSLAQMYDPNYGGFGRAPKFPPIQPLLLFLRYYHVSADEHYLKMVTDTLRHMARGGIYDHLAGGFARYSVDDKWLVPHFEKMLYDNALLVIVYLETYLITQDKFFLRIAEEILSFVDKKMRSAKGGFYSSLDADSDGEEGKYYVWSKKEIDQILGEHSPIFCDYYDVSDTGNFEGQNILHVQSDMLSTAARFNQPVKIIENILHESRQKLLAARAKRVPPGLDDKILTAWNGLMLSAFARAYQITRTPRYAEIIRTDIRFLKANLFSSDGLLRTYKKGRAKYSAFIEDYSFLIQALLDAYEALFDVEFLNWAEILMEQAEKKFWDTKDGGYFTADDQQKHLIFRLKDEHDQSVPSGTAIMLVNHLRFFALTQNTLHIERTESLLKKYSSSMNGNPYAYATYLIGLHFYLEKPKEIVFVFPPNHDDTLIREICNIYVPNRVIVLMDRTSQKSTKLFSAQLFDGKKAVKGKPTAYICHNFACSPPIHTLKEIKNLL